MSNNENEFDFFNAILFSKCNPEKLLCVSKKKFRYYKNKAFSYSDLKKLGYQEIDSLFYMKKIFFVDKKNKCLLVDEKHWASMQNTRQVLTSAAKLHLSFYLYFSLLSHWSNNSQNTSAAFLVLEKLK